MQILFKIGIMFFIIMLISCNSSTVSEERSNSKINQRLVNFDSINNFPVINGNNTQGVLYS
jgi:hypothetical protein